MNGNTATPAATATPQRSAEMSRSGRAGRSVAGASPIDGGGRTGGRFEQLLQSSTAAAAGPERAETGDDPEPLAPGAEQPPARKRAGDGEVPADSPPVPTPVEAARDGTFDRSICALLASGKPGVSPTDPAQSAPGALAVMGREMIRSASVEQLRGVTSVKLQISTPQIKQLQFRVRLDRGQLHTTFTLPDAAACELVRSAGPELEAALRSKGFEGAAVEVVRGETQAAGSHCEQRGGGRQWSQSADDAQAAGQSGSSAPRAAEAAAASTRAASGGHGQPPRRQRSTDYTL